jgi:hypothetical protein
MEQENIDLKAQKMMKARMEPSIVSIVIRAMLLVVQCRNPSLGLVTKARGYKVTSQKKNLGVISHVPRNAKSVME